jgi:hypothetical protein
VDLYEILLKSHIDLRRLGEYDTLDCQHLPDGTTRLTGCLRDQAELFSLLSRIRDLNLTLLTVNKQ